MVDRTMNIVRRLLSVLSVAFGLATLFAAEPVVAAAAPRKIVVVAGRKSHGPEGNRIHDYPWSAKLIKVLLDNSNVRDRVAVEVHRDGWPADGRTLETADALVILSDGRDGDQYAEALHLETPERVAVVDRLMKRGGGLAVIHFSTFAPDRYADPVLDWVGGYFDWEEGGRRQWYSAIKTLDAEVTLPTPAHPVARGVAPFRMNEEFYYNLRFREGDARWRPLAAVSALGGRVPNGNVVAWTVERTEGGRGFGTTCGHFYDNWRNADFRRLVLNAIVWTARAEVPPDGVASPWVERDEITRALQGVSGTQRAALSGADLFQRSNLVAWCIVPFDARKRGPEDRAAMLERLGIRRLAYDWRAEHVPTFDAEVEACRRHGIEVTAWWFPLTLDKDARTILEVIERHKIHPQLWVMGGGGPLGKDERQAERVAAEAARIKPIAEAAGRVGCTVGLYNHGGWFGEPENQLAIIERLLQDGVRNVGIVYNFHHGHDQIARFERMFAAMQRYLLCVNLNGMEIEGDRRSRKILHLGEGDQELAMMRVLRDSGWRGPVGIIDHRPETDSEETLGRNLGGLERLLIELKKPDAR